MEKSLSFSKFFIANDVRDYELGVCGYKAKLFFANLFSRLLISPLDKPVSRSEFQRTRWCRKLSILIYYCFQNVIIKSFFDYRNKFDYFLSQISQYSTVDLENSAVFIGGRLTGKIVAKFNKNGWSRLPNLNQGRWAHGSIQINTRTFIIGGKTDADWRNLSPLVTEVWNFESGENEIIGPTISPTTYRTGMAIFAVDEYFCNKLTKITTTIKTTTTTTIITTTTITTTTSMTLTTTKGEYLMSVSGPFYA